MSHVRNWAKNLSSQFLVGNYCVPELEGILSVDASSFSSPLSDLERNIGLFLGFHCNQLVRSTVVHAEEKMCQQMMTSEFLRGGIQALHTPNPFDDEKGEVASHASAAVTPLSEAEPAHAQVNTLLSLVNTVITLLSLVRPVSAPTPSHPGPW